MKTTSIFFRLKNGERIRLDVPLALEDFTDLDIMQYEESKQPVLTVSIDFKELLDPSKSALQQRMVQNYVDDRRPK